MINFRSQGFILTVCAVLWAVIALRVIMNNANQEREYIPPVASQQSIENFAKAQLNNLQARSFSEEVEYCGFIWEDPQGNLSASDIFRGDHSSCGYEFKWPLGVNPVAGYHTHGNYSPGYDAEAPSIMDIESDIWARIDGYISTPGGRLWHVDWQDATATQLCGEGCLRQDPDYRPCPTDTPSRQYSLASLEVRKRTMSSAC